MKRILFVSILALLAALVVAGCESDKPVAPDDSVYRVVLTLDKSSFNAAIGGEIRANFTAVLERDGEIVPSDTIQFRSYDPNVHILTPVVMTDASGRAAGEARIAITSDSRCAEIRAISHGEAASASVRIYTYPMPAQFVITPSVVRQLIGDGEHLTTRLEGIAVDSSGVAIQGLPLVARLRSEGGAIFGKISGNSTTSLQGEFTYTFDNLGFFGRETLLVRTNLDNIDGLPANISIPIEYISISTILGLFTVKADPDTVFPGDNGATVNLLATVKDTSGSPIIGLDVRFTATNGSISQTSGATDLNGLVSARLRLSDFSTISIVTAQLVRAPTITASDTIVVADPHLHPYRIELTSDVWYIVADGGAWAQLSARVLDHDGHAVEGALVSFTTNYGDLFATVNLTDNNGFAYAHLTAVGDSTLDTLTAVVIAKYADEAADTVYIEIRPVIHRIFDMTLTYNAPSTEIRARIFDQFDHPVSSGQFVSFYAPIGYLLVVFPTDSNGVAKAKIRGIDNGREPVIVSARWNDLFRSITIPGTERYPSYISFTNDGGPLYPPGTGGDSVMVFTVTVTDQFGELFEPPITVMAQLLNSPEPPLGGHWGRGGTLDSAVTEHGRGTLELHSGTQIGGKLIRAFTWRDWDAEHAGADGIARTDTMSVVLSTVAVVAGPPYQMDLDVNDNGEDAGGGTWQIPVSARVWDLYRNPVADNIPVVFTVDPQIATIDPGRTGNDIGQGQTIGIAYSWLRYHSTNTGAPITIRAEVQLADGMLTAERQHILPLQQGALSLQIAPEDWVFDRARPNDTCLIKATAVLTDGHGIAINHMPILFRTDRARFYWKNLRLNGRYIPFFPEAARRYTGFVNAENNEPAGTATVYLRGIMADFFLDNVSLQVNVHIEAQVEGYDIAADPVVMYLVRW